MIKLQSLIIKMMKEINLQRRSRLFISKRKRICEQSFIFFLTLLYCFYLIELDYYSGKFLRFTMVEFNFIKRAKAN